jgi:hypothetical protein
MKKKHIPFPDGMVSVCSDFFHPVRNEEKEEMNMRIFAQALDQIVRWINEDCTIIVHPPTAYPDEGVYLYRSDYFAGIRSSALDVYRPIWETEGESDEWTV